MKIAARWVLDLGGTATLGTATAGIVAWLLVGLDRANAHGASGVDLSALAWAERMGWLSPATFGLAAWFVARRWALRGDVAALEISGVPARRRLVGLTAVTGVIWALAWSPVAGVAPPSDTRLRRIEPGVWQFDGQRSEHSGSTVRILGVEPPPRAADATTHAGPREHGSPEAVGRPLATVLLGVGAAASALAGGSWLPVLLICASWRILANTASTLAEHGSIQPWVAGSVPPLVSGLILAALALRRR